MQLLFYKKSKKSEAQWETFLENMEKINTHTHIHTAQTHKQNALPYFYFYFPEKSFWYLKRNRCVKSFISFESRLSCCYDHNKSKRNCYYYIKFFITIKKYKYKEIILLNGQNKVYLSRKYKIRIAYTILLFKEF